MLIDLLHFEDLTLGGSWTTRARTITETDLVNHAANSGDWGPLHVNQELASAGHFGSRVAHGSLVISIAMGLGSMDVPQTATVGLVGTGWRFMRPVRPGDTIRAHWRLSRKRDVDEPRWGLAVWRIEITNQRQEIVAEGEVTVLVAKREVPHVPIASPASKRRRRRRGRDPLPAGAPQVATGPPPIEANLPEPAAVDTPAPRTRRRPAGSKPAPEPVAQVVPSAPAPPDETPVPTSASARRRRRRRGGGGGGNSGGGAAPTGLAAEGSIPVATPAPVEPAPSEPTITPSVGPAGGVFMRTPAPIADQNPIGQILKRFRRPRPAPKPAPSA